MQRDVVRQIGEEQLKLFEKKRRTGYNHFGQLQGQV
jgi:hypothetical protein